MSAKKSLSHKLSIAAAVLGLVAISSVLINGQSPQKQATGVPYDWSHHRLIFSNPGSFAEAMKNGTVEKWNRVMNDPRFKMQQIRRSLTQRALAAAPDFAARTAILSSFGQIAANPIARRPIPKLGQPIGKDWNMALGPISGATLTANVGSTIDVTTLPNGSTFSLDSVTFTANPPTSESQTLTVNSLPTLTSNTVTITKSPNSFVLTENGSAASATGTFAAAPTSTATLFTITNAGNTFNVATSATASSATGTFTSPLVGTSIVIPSGTGAGTVTLTSAGTGTVAFAAVPAVGDT